MMGILRYDLYSDDAAGNGMPIVLVPVFGDEGGKLWQEMRISGCAACVLAAVTVADWDVDLSPWEAKKVFKGGNDFGSGADQTLKALTDTVIPEIRERTGIREGRCWIAGYSFSGLFALYSLYRTNIFDGAASVSGSLWFPGFAEYAAEHAMCRMPSRLYFSLGDQESRTRNEVMKTVGEKTDTLYRHFKNQGIDCVYEMNPGNHFQDPEQRLSKGIHWLLENKK